MNILKDRLQFTDEKREKLLFYLIHPLNSSRIAFTLFLISLPFLVIALVVRSLVVLYIFLIVSFIVTICYYALLFIPFFLLKSKPGDRRAKRELRYTRIGIVSIFIFIVTAYFLLNYRVNPLFDAAVGFILLALLVPLLKAIPPGIGAAIGGLVVKWAHKLVTIDDKQEAMPKGKTRKRH